MFKTSRLVVLLLLVLLAAPAFPQGTEVVIAASGAPDVVPEPSPPTPASPQAATNRKGWQVIIYPVFGFAPLFSGGASYPTIDFPNIGSGNGVSNGIASSSTSTALNSAAFAGFRVQKSRWVVEGSFEYAGLGASKSLPRLNMGLDFTYGQLLVGGEVLPNLYVNGGFRRIAAKISVDLLTLPTLSTKPGLWDPLIGMTYRKHLGKKWAVQAHMDGGGFGVGADEDIFGSLNAEWRFTKHFGMSFGAAALHLAMSPQVRNRSLDFSTTMWGPVFGFGIYLGRPE